MRTTWRLCESVQRGSKLSAACLHCRRIEMRDVLLQITLFVEYTKVRIKSLVTPAQYSSHKNISIHKNAWGGGAV